MPVQLRPDKKLAKLVYKLLSVPKPLQQKNEKQPTERQAQSWQAARSTGS